MLGGGGESGGSAKRFLVAGAVGGVACATAVTPGERIKVLLQSSGGLPQGALAATRALLRQGGWPALFIGLRATILREIPGTIIWFGAFELISQWLERSASVPRTSRE